ncbi:MAG: phosphate ABC transporter substrate-binding protein PstS [Synechococcaceae cyanobacterium]|nr:phosphate ABC transporter substrate-binding protein PstS [Synechococcaceae cyanobacterium]
MTAWYGTFSGLLRSLPRRRVATCSGATASLIAAAVAGCSVSSTLNGAGASFPAPIYQNWFQGLAAKGLRVNYQSVGSGAGVRQFLAGTVDFAGSDVPLAAAEQGRAPRGVVQIPMTAGAIAVAYNHPGCKLRLSQAQLADVFLGRITDFSQLGCAARPIRVVVRSDGSGTTANFTAHLAAISPAWSQGPGKGKLIQWPTGIGAKGNEGVAAQISQGEGSLGYVEASYVKAPLQAAALSNASGDQLLPDAANGMAALEAIRLDAQLIGADPNPSRGYPIVSFSWILLPARDNGPRLATLRQVFSATLSDEAQAKAPSLGYLPLPESVRQRGRALLASGVR